MTLISITEAKIRDHRRNADLYEKFAVQAEEDGKFCMGILYRRIVTGHMVAADSLEGQLQKMRGDAGNNVATQSANPI